MTANHWRISMALPATALLAGVAQAQFNNQWVEFERDNSRVNAPSSLVLNDGEEKDYIWGDVNNDGWTDLVIARKQPFTSSGRRTNVLLMNENGVLTDRTSEYASDSDTPGDNGFETPTNDRDVVLADVDQDGWLDIVTATTLSAGQPKHISHPRVYMNLGDNGSGWEGFRYEEARIPVFPISPGFCSVAAGDLTDDGYPDLFFTDYSGIYGPDLNDRVLINDGNGFFTDESTARMSSTMLESNFGASADIVDFNLDGYNDVLKTSGLAGVSRLNYNDPGNVGYFNLTHLPYSSAAYFASVGDLNNDDRPDLVISDDGADRHIYNTGNDALGRVIWGPAKTFQFLTGSDFEFGGNSLVADLDNDEWNDALITDVDVDIPGCGGRTHIYHNPGGTPGQQITLLEEAQSPNGGWRGVVGTTANDLRGTHDVAVFDIDNDGDNDMILGRCSVTDVWINQLDPDQSIGTNYCVGATNSTGAGGQIAASGSESVGAQNVTLTASSCPGPTPGLFFFGTTQVQNVFGDGFLCTSGSIVRVAPPEFTDGSGVASRLLDFSASYAGSIVAGATLNFQYWYRDVPGGPAGFNLTDAVSIAFQP